MPEDGVDGARPVLAGALTVVGGAAITAGALAVGVAGSPLARVFGLPLSLYPIGLALGISSLAAGALVLAVPRARRPLGVLAIGCAFASLPFAFGGFVLGFGLTAVGGAIAASRRGGPTSPTAPSGRSPPWT